MKRSSTFTNATIGYTNELLVTDNEIIIKCRVNSAGCFDFGLMKRLMRYDSEPLCRAALPYVVPCYGGTALKIHFQLKITNTMCGTGYPVSSVIHVYLYLSMLEIVLFLEYNSQDEQ